MFGFHAKGIWIGGRESMALQTLEMQQYKNVHSYRDAAISHIVIENPGRKYN